MKLFISGVMQGSIQGTGIQKQDYRRILTDIIKDNHPGVEIVDPIKLFPDSVTFDNEKAKAVLNELVDIAANADLVVAYLPEASMGTAMEMLRAHDKGKPIVTITTMQKNWFILAMSNVIVPSIEAFEDWVSKTNLEKWVSEQK